MSTKKEILTSILEEQKSQGKLLREINIYLCEDPLRKIKLEKELKNYE